MSDINPKMQPKIKAQFRRWQHNGEENIARNDYYYGECPVCGQIGSNTFEDHNMEFWECSNPDCDVYWEYEIGRVFRFARIVPEDER